MTLLTVFTSAVAAPTTSTTTKTAEAAAAAHSTAQHTVTAAVPVTATSTKAAATTTSLKKTSQNTIDVSSGIVYTALQAPLEGSRLRKRHSKRHSNWYDFINFNENTTELEWVNPCGGFYVPSATESVRTKRRKHPKQIFNMLKKSAGNEYKMLKAGQQDIDISNIQIWSLHNKTYKFLPKLKSNSTIALKRWYRNIQSYVASFAYLRRVQRAWDMAKLQRENSTARELKMLLFSARRMLCELETAINGTMPTPRALRGNRLPHVTRNQMNKRLKLYTKRRAERYPTMLQEANSIDLMWVKYYYYDFLETMWKVLRQKTKRRGQVALAQHPKAYNEVEKHFGSIAAAMTRHEAAAPSGSVDGSSESVEKRANGGRMAQLKRGNAGGSGSSSKGASHRRVTTASTAGGAGGGGGSRRRPAHARTNRR
ncbi:PREDICTED: uncharacterized protein LOC108367072, partial [Rhagoletis zephyria]|uniref:uncharacterized protein LOC108367072 n=1 Tax=Rhagoletis zephyria TaxID=28612 RepID=UPI00081127E0